MSTEKLPPLSLEHRADRIRAERLELAYSKLTNILRRATLSAADQAEFEKVEHELFGHLPRYGTFRSGENKK